MSALQGSFVVQVRVISALLLRDFVVQAGRGAVPLFYIFMRPILLILIAYLVMSSSDALAPAGFPLLIFVITGYLTWIGFLHCFTQVSIQTMTSLLMFPNVTPLDLMLGRVGVEFMIHTILFLVLCALGILFARTPLPADPLGVLLAFWSAIGLGLALGIIIASVRRFTTLLDDLVIAIRVAGHAASGVLALASSTPQFLLNYMSWNPLFHSIEWLRQSWWPGYKSPLADPLYIAESLFFLTAIALAFERATRRWHK